MPTNHSLHTQLTHHLKRIYGSDYKEDYTDQMENLFQKWKKKDRMPSERLSEKNVYLITYGDSIQEEGEAPLSVLHRFLKEEAGDILTDVHLLPMFPYTSDDGFSVVDYREINPDLGSWDDIAEFSEDFRLMFDFVANHMSKSSPWFQRFLADDPEYAGYFIEEGETFDTSRVIRPRTSPLFHEYEGKNGVKSVWTTFSEDQVDVNFAHFPVLLEMTDILLEYLDKGATSIRLDAIGFIWKESGTTCMHLPQAHEIIRLWHTLVEQVHSDVQIITETNVPHQENISYLGDGTDEAHMVYQFTLPPLVQYSFAVHNAEKLTEWAKTIHKVSDQATYFNFLASHDGIGIRPVEGILNEAELNVLLKKVTQNGGAISYKANPDGTESPYELNINYMEMLKEEGDSEERLVQKSLAAHAILLSFIGVPAIYYHSLLGSGNDRKGMEESGINRRINREKLVYSELKKELNEDSRRRGVFQGMKEMIDIRKSSSAFSPYADQEVLSLDDRVFSLTRYNEETGERIFFAVNMSNEDVSVMLPFAGENLRTNQWMEGSQLLSPYQFMWIQK